MHLRRWARAEHPLTFTGYLRYEVVRELLRDLGAECRVLEVGAGAGALASRLADIVPYVGYEPDSISYETASRRLGGRGKLYNSVLPDEPYRQFDVVIALEVLEHIEDDVGALETWRAWIRPGGHLVLSVPADPARFGPADEAVGHFRRYSEGDLSRVLNHAGFEAERLVRYGYPIANLTESLRSHLARHGRSSPRDRASATAESGRYLQPGAALGRLLPVIAAPFAAIQLRASSNGRGRGLVARARRREPPRT